MADSIDINLTGDALDVLKQMYAELTALTGKVDLFEEETRDAFEKMKKSVESISLVSITQGFENFKNTLSSVNAPGLSFESQMADLSAITGIVGDDLDYLGQKAIENSKNLGGTASEGVEVYKLLLSQLTPELAKFPDVLNGMSRDVILLSKTMKGDTAGAVEVLTTAFNQYGVSLDDPIKAQKELNNIMNIMAAGAKEGSAELPVLKEAIQNVGGDAKSSGLDFQTMVSAIESLDKAGKKGAEGGVALRNVLASLNQGRFLPEDVQAELRSANIDINTLSDSSISFTDRLRALQPIVGDAALLSKLFGKENKLAAEALINSVDAQDKMTQAITGTNTAEEQANIIMATKAEGLGRISAWFDSIKIGLFEATGAMMPFMEITFGALQGLSTIVPAITAVTTAVNFLRAAETRLIIAQRLRAMWTNITSIATMRAMLVQKTQAMWTGVVTAAQWLWNIAMTMNPIGIIIVAIGALVAGIAWLTYGFKGFGDFFINFWDNLKKWFWNLVDFWNKWLNPFNWLLELIDTIFPGAKKAIVDFFSDLWDSIYAIFFQPWVDAWNATMGFFFGEQELSGEVKHTLETDEERHKKALSMDKGKGENALSQKNQKAYGNMPYGGGASGGGSKGGSTSKGAGFASAEKKEINTTIDKLVNNLIINVPEVSMSMAKIREMISEALIGAVRDFEVTVD